ncbi:MAG: hypothetical protein RL442_34 [Pseudomonadota bacterium]
MKSMEAGVGIEPAYTDLQWDRPKKCPENQGTRFWQLLRGTSPRHNFGTASGQQKSTLSLTPTHQAGQLPATASSPQHQLLSSPRPVPCIDLAPQG